MTPAGLGKAADEHFIAGIKKQYLDKMSGFSYLLEDFLIPLEKIPATDVRNQRHITRPILRLVNKFDKGWEE